MTDKEASRFDIFPSMKPSESVEIVSKDRSKGWLMNSLRCLEGCGPPCCSGSESSMSVSSG